MKFKDVADKVLNELKEVVFHIYREDAGENYTNGELYVKETRLCYTLEDTLRGYGEKVNGETCIPAGIYDLDISYSPSFKKDLPIIYNQPDKLTLINNGVSFVGVRLHGGNDVDDTEGCPLIAYNRIKDNIIQGSASKDVTELIKYLKDKGYSLKIHVHNNPFNFGI